MAWLLVGLLPAVPAQAAASWTVSWAVAMSGNLGNQYASDATVRQVAPLSVGGTEVRAQISNKYGDLPLTVTAATVALAGTGPALAPGSLRSLTFNGAASATVPVGGSVYSDAVPLTVHAGQSVAVSVYVAGHDLITEHYDAGNGVSYASIEGGGNLSADESGGGLAYPQTWDRFVSAIDVAGGTTPPHATVVLGDSISDGYNFHCPGEQSYCTLTTAWPTILAGRLLNLPAAQRVGVANEAITANTVLPLTDDYSRGGGGEAGSTRLASDVLAQPGIDRMFLLLGTNDLWFGATAAQVIAGYRAILAQAAAAGVPVIASTLLPRSSGGKETWTPAMEANRVAVNDWIRHSGAFAAVVDLAEVIGDVYNGACQPDVMYPPYDSGDHLHPNTAGQTAIADAIPTPLLGAGTAPAAAPLVAVTPTPGCQRDPVVTINSPLLTSTTPPSTTTTTTSTVPTTSPPTDSPTTGRPDHRTPLAAGATHSSSKTSVGLLVAIAALGITFLTAAVKLWPRSSQRRRR